MSKFHFDEVIKKVEQTKNDVTKKVANLTQNYFVLAFRKQGFNNNQWKEVNRRIEGTKEYKYPKTKGLTRRTKPILIGTGELRRETANSIVIDTWPTVKLLIDLPYAAVHNEGDGKIPKRQFAGQTEELTQKQSELIQREFDKIWK